MLSFTALQVSPTMTTSATEKPVNVKKVNLAEGIYRVSKLYGIGMRHSEVPNFTVDIKHR